MAVYSRKKFSRALVSMLQKHTVKDVAMGAAKEIIEQHWLRDIDAILRDVAAESLSGQKHLEAEVISAHAISQNLRTSITSLLSSRYQAQTVNLTEKIDPSIVGGLIITTPIEAIDASIKTKLTTLKHHT